MEQEERTITLIEGLAYLHPHKPEIVASHPAMKGVWTHCRKLLNQHKGSFMAPLLIDGLDRDGKICDQTLYSLIERNTGLPYSRWPWFGDPVQEEDIAAQFDHLGCKAYDSVYHQLVIQSLSLTDFDWKWISVNPVGFMEQQAGMLVMLWKMLSSCIDFNAIGQMRQISGDDVRKGMREGFLSKFEHQWIDDEGKVVSVTKPSYKSGKVIHAPV